MSTKSEIKTDFLVERINQNEKNQTLDINKWAFGFLPAEDRKMKILELCCGTGKQTAWLLEKFPHAEVSCLDASADAIDMIRQTFKNESGRMKCYHELIDDFFSKNQEIFDIIFCSYGLYYATDISAVLGKIDEALMPGGRLMVMGPYGDNNKQLFDVVRNAGVTIPPLVFSSSSTFMVETVLSHAVKTFETIHIHTAQNNVFWNDVESVMNYWKNSTFFDPSAEAYFHKTVSDHIKANGNFLNEKRIMFLEAIKHL